MGRNKSIWEDMSERLRQLDIYRTWAQCKDKIRNLTQKYRIARNLNSRSGNRLATCQFYEELDSILGCRDLTEPANIIESLQSQSFQIVTEVNPTFPAEEVLDFSCRTSSTADFENTDIHEFNSEVETSVRHASADVNDISSVTARRTAKSSKSTVNSGKCIYKHLLK
ncbi:Uncharacterised protein r2_g4202 [Pycnogonum litorale]